MTDKRFYMDKGGDLYDNDNLLMLDFGYSYDGVGCKKIIDLLNELNDENKELKSLCKVLITHIEKNSIAFVIDENIRRLLE